MAAKGQPPSSDCIPVTPIRRIVGEALARKKAAYRRTTGLVEDHEWNGELVGPNASLVFDIWGSEENFSPVYCARALYRLLNEQEFIKFDSADKILCGLGLFMLWHEDPELNAIWNSGVVAEADEREARLAAQAAA